VAPTSIRGIRPQFAKAVALTSWVVRHLPRRRRKTTRRRQRLLRAGLEFGNDIGSFGRTPVSPWK
jgi:hypothetical protein